MVFQNNSYLLNLYRTRFEKLRVDFWNQEDILRNFLLISPFIKRIENEINFISDYKYTISNLKEKRKVNNYLDSLNEIKVNFDNLKFQYDDLIKRYNREIKIFLLDDSNKIKGIEKIIFNNSKEKEVLIFQNFTTYYIQNKKIKTQKSNFKYKKSYDDINFAIKSEEIEKFKTYLVLNDKYLNLNSVIIPIFTVKFNLGNFEVLEDVHKII